jgi:protein-S-isoprenylcysteine O-methyltransferase Ste14
MSGEFFDYFQLISVDLYLVGTFLINGTVIFLLLAILVVAGLHYQILQEEKFLAQPYGKAYRNYCAQTRRYFGRRRASQGIRLSTWVDGASHQR